MFTNSYALTKIDEDVEDGRGVRKKSARLSVMDVNSGTTKPTPSQVADIWKELTLTRWVVAMYGMLGANLVACTISTLKSCCRWGGNRAMWSLYL